MPNLLPAALFLEVSSFHLKRHVVVNHRKTLISFVMPRNHVHSPLKALMLKSVKCICANIECLENRWMVLESVNFVFRDSWNLEMIFVISWRDLPPPPPPPPPPSHTSLNWNRWCRCSLRCRPQQKHDVQTKHLYRD